MSSDMLAQVLRFSNPILTRPQKNLLLVLAYHTNPTSGLAYPGHRLLALELMITERQVKTLVRRVVKTGWVEVRPGQGRGHLSVYRLTLPPDEVIPRKGEMLNSPSPEKRGNPAPEKGKSAVTPYKEVEREKKGEMGSPWMASRPETYRECPLCQINHQPGPCRDPWRTDACPNDTAPVGHTPRDQIP